MVSREKPRVPIEFDSQTTRDQHQISTSQFCKYLPTHPHNSISD